MSLKPRPKRSDPDPDDLPPPRSADEALRRAGWKIASRPARGEPTWTRDGLTKSQSQALALSGLTNWLESVEPVD